MAAELGLAITTEALFAVAKHCKDACSAVKRYPEAAARIRLRLTYLLSRVPEWSDRIDTINNDDDGCRHLARNLYESLTDLTLCVQAMGSSNDGPWRKKIRLFLEGKKLLDALNEAEAKLNQALLDLNHDSTNFIASHILKIYEQFRQVNDIDGKKSLMVSLCNQMDQLPAENENNPTATLNDFIQDTLEECHKKDELNSNVSDGYSTLKNVSSTTDLTTDECIATIDRSNVHFDASLNTRIGKGGFAEVFKGRFNNDDVAVKVIDIYRNVDRIDELPEILYQAECNRVRDEATLMKQCSVHANIVDVFGYCPPLEAGSKPLIVMELMYASLNRILHQTTDLPLLYITRLHLMKDIACAIEFLHLQGIVHQDVKASNVLVDINLTTAKLTDFGVAECKGLKTTWNERHHTSLATVLKNANKHAAGTLAYQAPELVLKQVTTASRSADIYSLGVTIWECLSRTIPHHNKENEIILLAHDASKFMMQFPVKDLVTDNNITPNEYDSFTLLEKISFICTAKNPSSRPNASDVIQYLENTRTISDSLFTKPLSHLVDNLTTTSNNPVQSRHRSLMSNNQSSTMDPDPSINETDGSNTNDTEIIMHSSFFRWIKKVINSKMLLALFALALVAVVAVILIIIKIVKDKKSKSVLCFKTNSDLRASVIAYRNRNTAVYNQYGTFIGDWCVRNVTDFSNLFYDDTGLFKTFNDDISKWETSAAETMAYMFRDAAAFNQDLSSWDVSSVKNMSNMFSNTIAFNQDISSWDVSSVKDMSNMFQKAKAYNKDLSSWDVSSVTDMSRMFKDANSFNQPLSNWNVSLVTNMAYMFQFARAFNQNISSWDVSSVTDMSFLFGDAVEFNQDLSSWNVSKVTNMQSTFDSARAFNTSISSWDVSSVTNMAWMFADATSFNQPLLSWDVSSVTSMLFMFSVAVAFDRDLSAWNVSSVTNMARMFEKTNFNQDLSLWDVSSVSNMSYMFNEAQVYNQNLSSWDVSSVTDMSGMFENTFAFNQDLSSWNVLSVTNMSHMFSKSEYNQNLSSWDVSSVTSMVKMFMGARLFNQSLCEWGERLNVNTVVTQMFQYSGCRNDTDPILTSNSVTGPFCYSC